MSKLPTTRPPWLGRILSRLIVGHGADALRGDLDESFQRRLTERGNTFTVRGAYVVDVLLSVAHWWWSALWPADGVSLRHLIRRPGYAAIVDDVRYGARMLVKHPGFTLVAVISLGVGIGTTTTVFGLVNAVLMRPLPVKDAATLVSVNKPEPDGSRIHHISYPEYLEYRGRADIFSDLLAWTEATVSVDLDGLPEQTYAMLVSGNYFSVLGARPAIGRLFTAEEGRVPGEHPVTVLGFAFWQRRFGSDSSVVGRKIQLNGQPFTVIGVAARGFTSTYNVFAPALYAPLMMQPQLMSRPGVLLSRGQRSLKLTGRLATGVTRERAQAAMSAIDRQLEQADSPTDKSPNRLNRGVELVPVGSYPLDIQLALLGGAALLMAIVGSVLLIACANVAGMLLARATVRRREIAVRLALGATRGRLIRQLLTESCLLFLVAGTLGMGLTVWLTRLVTTIPLPVALPFALEANVDWRVLTFTLALALVTGVVFGLAPALESARVNLQAAMTDGASTAGFKRSRIRQAFVVGQIALSLVLLIGAGLFSRALQYGQTLYPGRKPEGVLTARVDPQALGYTVPRARELHQQVMQRVAALPGVDAVSMVRDLQIGDGYGVTSVALQDGPELRRYDIESNEVTPRYFETVGIRMLSGRDFTSMDRDSAARVVIVNAAMARRFWLGGSALGQRVHVGDGWAEIIGVVEDGRHRIAGQSSPPSVYWPFLQSGSHNSGMTLLLRYRGDKATVLTALRGEIRTLDPRLPLQFPMTLSEAVQTITLPWRAAGVLATVFGFIGLALAALGIYGLVAYTVSQRTREIGVRVALGADPFDIRRLVIGHGLKLALLGVAIGLTLAFAVTRALTSFLFGVSASDPATYFGESFLLVAVALAASYIPARKATMTDPLIALRHE